MLTCWFKWFLFEGSAPLGTPEARTSCHLTVHKRLLKELGLLCESTHLHWSQLTLSRWSEVCSRAGQLELSQEHQHCKEQSPATDHILRQWASEGIRNKVFNALLPHCIILNRSQLRSLSFPLNARKNNVNAHQMRFQKEILPEKVLCMQQEIIAGSLWL